MKNIENYSEEIYKCTKCGLCQSVCPVFEETGLEGAVSRGKFTLLNGIIKGDLKFSKNVSKYLDLCLNCNACSEFCPSGIDAEEIITAAKYESFKLGNSSFFKQLIVSNFSSKLRLNLIRFALNTYRGLKLSKITGRASFLLGKHGNAVKLFNAFTRTNIRYSKIISQKPKSALKIVYFPGCINNYINPSVKNAIKIVLESNGIELIIPDFSCCGIPARSTGNIEEFVRLAKENLEKIDKDVDYLISDCATCGTVWKLYSETLEDDTYRQKAEILAKKSININELLVKMDLNLPEGSKNKKKVTYHDPCHLKRFSGVSCEPREILEKIPNVEFIEMKDADKCCGASGTFCITKSIISKAISVKKANNIIDTEADIVSTSCPSCTIGLLQGLIEQNKALPVYQPVELIAEIILENN